MTRAGGKTFVWTCGMCGSRAEGYAPRNFQTTTIGTRRTDGVQQWDESGITCSALCEARYLIQETTKRINELLGDE